MTIGDRVRDKLRPPLDQRIAFLHVPKCGGSSLTAALSKHYYPGRTTRRRNVEHLNGIASEYAVSITQVPQMTLKRAFLAYTLAATPARLITGHFAFSRPVHEAYKDRWDFISLLREPVARWLSNYSYNLGQDTIFGIDAPLEEFVSSERAASLGTMITRTFGEVNTAAEAHDRGTIQSAITALRDLALLGRLEDLADFSATFEARYGRRLEIPRVRVTDAKKRVRPADLSPELQARIAELCAPDLEVYRTLFPD